MVKISENYWINKYILPSYITYILLIIILMKSHFCWNPAKSAVRCLRQKMNVLCSTANNYTPSFLKKHQHFRDDYRINKTKQAAKERLWHHTFFRINIIKNRDWWMSRDNGGIPVPRIPWKLKATGQSGSGQKSAGQSRG